MDAVYRLKTIKAKECCCGCTLRTGTLTLLWLFLIFNSFGLLYYLKEVIYKEDSPEATFLRVRAAFLFISSTAGVITSLYGIYGIQKNIAKLLTCSFYYFLYNVIFVFLCVMLILIKFEWHKKFITGDMSNYKSKGESEAAFMFVMSYLFSGALLSYFAIIIRSCRDTMEKNLATRQFNSIPDAAAAGYNVA